MDTWQSKAACRLAPLEEFFPEGDRMYEHARATAHRWCSQCPVTRECWAFAKAQDAWGVWGGQFLKPQLSRSLGA